MSFRILNNERGVAMAIVLAILLMLGLVGVAAIQHSSTDMDISEAMTDRTKAFYAAEGGLELALATMRANPTIVARDSIMPLVNAKTSLGDVYFKVAMTTDYPVRTVSTVGRGADGEASVAVDVYHRRTPINAWNNAVFAGVGQSGRGIAGNVDIHGSVHILGDGEPFTDQNGNAQWDDDDEYTDLNGDGVWNPGEPITVDHDGDGTWDPAEPFVDETGNGTYDETLTATDLSFEASGAAAVVNNYYGMPATISGQIPPLTTIPFNGEMVSTLDAELRVKHGRVNLSGTADGAYVNDGYGGTSGTANVSSDNGTANGYDLPEDAIKFPSLNDTADGYADHRAYLAANALIIPGDLELKVGETYTSPGSAKGSLSIDANGNLKVSGIVMVTGDLRISAGHGSLRGEPVVYDGRGTLVSQGDMYVDTHVLSKGKFPSDDVLGLLSYQDLAIGSGPGAAQLDIMGAIYAQHQITNQKQNHIAGAMVSNHFAMQNVPSIYHVPDIVDNLPPGLPGGATLNFYVWKELAATWREVHPIY
jgi:hypothetical protein